MLFAQTLVSGLVAGAVYALMALGFSLVYNVHKVINIAHGATYAIGAFVTYGLSELCGLSVMASIPVGLLASSAFSLACDAVIFKPLRTVTTSAFSTLVASFAVYVMVQNGLQIIFGSNLCSFTSTVSEGIPIGPARVTPIEIATLAASTVSFVALGAFLHYTTLGKLWRAMAQDRDRLEMLGADPRPLDRQIFILAGILAGAAGILVSLRTAFRCDMGLDAVIRGLCATIVGGVGSIPGTIVGGMILGLLEAVAVVSFSARYKDSVALVLLILFLLFRPSGIIGHRDRPDATGGTW